MRIHHSPYQSYHHQIIFSKFRLKVCYIHLHDRTIFYYPHANADHIQKVANLFDFQVAFINTGIDVKVSHFSNTVLNIQNK